MPDKSKEDSDTQLSNSSKQSLIAEKAWYLAVAKPRQERRAVEQLQNQSINAFCPMVKVEKIVRGKKQIVDEALFTSYLFVQLAEDSPLWHKVRSTRGVRDWVRFAGRVAKVPQKLVENLIAAENNLDKPIIINRFKPGQAVRVLEGPFAGLKGIYQKDDGERRSMILVEFLGQPSRLKVNNEQISTE